MIWTKKVITPDGLWNPRFSRLMEHTTHTACQYPVSFLTGPYSVVNGHFWKALILAEVLSEKGTHFAVIKNSQYN